MIDIKKIDIDSIDFPEHLREIPRAPKCLYYSGNLELIQKPGIAVVGTRRCSPYGSWVAYEIGRRIGKTGATHISGMAEGIDSKGHEGVLDVNGSTVAVLGCGVDVCFPRSNTKLYEKILQKGLILSEYEPGVTPQSYFFPERNRIISGLSRAVIVVEGAIKSGSIITANLALAQGRDVYAVPGNINQPNSVGVNMLIRDGAMPILNLDELTTTLGLNEVKMEKAQTRCTKEELAILDVIKFEPGIGLEGVAIKLDMSLADVSYLVSSLELKDYIDNSGNGLFIK